MSGTKRPESRPEKIYGWLLRFYPNEFRREYGEPMSQLFRDKWRDAKREGSRRTLVRLWLDTLLDVAVSAPHETLSGARRNKMNPLFDRMKALNITPGVLVWIVPALALVVGSSVLRKVLPHGGD